MQNAAVRVRKCKPKFGAIQIAKHSKVEEGRSCTHRRYDSPSRHHQQQQTAAERFEIPHNYCYASQRAKHLPMVQINVCRSL